MFHGIRHGFRSEESQRHSDVRIDRVVIDDLWNSVYYAKIYLKVDKDELEIDSRPSDAVAIAVRFGAPIYVADGILDLGDEG